MAVAEDQMTGDARGVVAELLEQRGQSIALVPATGTVTEKPGGGKDYGPGPARPAQTFALFNTTGVDARQESSADQGTTRQFRYSMVGAYDAVVEVGDSWEDDVAKYTVVSVDNTQPYQVKAVVTAFLKSAGHGIG